MSTAVRRVVLSCMLLMACGAPTASGPAPGPVATYGGACTSRGGLPDPSCTPGDADPRVTQDNVHSTICRRGYTRAVRPPLQESHRLKVALTRAYGIGNVPFSKVELDHLIPLSLGGSSDVKNLWPQFRSGPASVDDKDAIGSSLNRKVCSGQLSLRAAQRAMATNWRTAG